MCGITGAFAFTQPGKEYVQSMVAANRSLEKRGPDGGDVFCKDNAVLAHRRLSIIDVSCNGSQPMHSHNGQYTIVFNGEIFNYRELKQQYLSAEEQGGLVSTSDTEIFLLLFTRLKEKVFALLHGFFAAAIYDHAAQELTLVRDRYGKKPLLIYQDKEKLFFASEMKALFAAGIPAKLNASLLPTYLQLNYVPQPYSLVEGVRKLPPGHFLTVSKSATTERAYYNLSLHPERYADFTYEQAQEEFIRLMDNAVKKRLIADVPLGAFLSGGIDSSVVVALASKHTRQLSTFSIGYKDNPYFDETRYANLVAKQYKTDHTVFSLSADDFLEHLFSVLDYIDEPFADSSAIPQYILSYHTHKHVTVALSGDGGDEVFAGYRKHGAEFKMRSGGLMNTVATLGSPVWAVLPKSRNNALTNKFRQLHRFAAGAKIPAAERYWRWASLADHQTAASFLTKTVAKAENGRGGSIFSEFTGDINGGDFNEVLLADMKLVLLSDMLVKVDLMSMANSLEVRSPFLDHEVVEFAFGLPAAYKIDKSLKKKIVQDAFRSFLPAELYNRPKQGFEIPLLQWLRKDLWSLIDGDLLGAEFVRAQGIFDSDAIERLKRKLQSANPEDSHATVWALVVFQYWWKKYMA